MFACSSQITEIESGKTNNKQQQLKRDNEIENECDEIFIVSLIMLAF